MTWVKCNSSYGVVNLDHASKLMVRENPSGAWEIAVFLPVSPAPVAVLNGTWTTAQDAQAALAQITSAVDSAAL